MPYSLQNPPIVGLIALTLAVVLPFVPAAAGSAPQISVAGEAAGLEGHWEGTIEIPGQELKFDTDFSRVGDGWAGDVSIPAQGAQDLPLKDLSLEADQVTFVISGIPGDPTFSGTLSDDGTRISGEFAQGGQTFPFSLTSGVAPADEARAALAEVDAIIDAALEDWQTPGMAVAVVVDGEVVLCRGYGLRDQEEQLPATARTLFAIGSCTKAFTAFCMATLADEGLLDWDRPVVEYLPNFQMYDEYATAHLTPRDMVRTARGCRGTIWSGTTTRP